MGRWGVCIVVGVFVPVGYGQLIAGVGAELLFGCRCMHFVEAL